MITSLKTKTAAIAAIGVLGFTGAGVAVAATVSSDAPTPLTGSITDRASTAALAKYPDGTLVGLRSAPDGTYLAEVRKADGSVVGVELDKDFKVTGTRAGGPGHGGRGGRGGFDTAALAKTLGVTEAKLQAALEATRGPKGDEKKQNSDHAATIAKALGASTADVQSVLDAQRDDRPGGDRDRGGRPGGPGGRGDHRGPGGPGGPGKHGDSALVTALAKKTGKSEADVTKALESVHTARKDAEVTALAKELGVDAAKVKAALEAARPDKPADRP